MKGMEEFNFLKVIIMANKNKVLLIVNPCAGPDRKRVNVDEIVRLFPAEYEFDIRETKGRGDATTFAENCPDDIDVIVCNGGDGTLNETLNGVMKLNRRVPVGYIPTGSTNDLATTLGIPTDIKAAVDLIVSGNTNTYDLGNFNGRFYEYIASFGAFTSSSYGTSQKMKNKLGHFAYLLDGFLHWGGIKAVPVHIEYDGGVIDDKIMLGAVFNSTSVSGILKFDPKEIKLNDGLFEILMIKDIKVIEAPAMLRKLLKKDYSDERILYAKTRHFKMTSEEGVPWTVDGEYGGDPKETIISVEEKAIDIISTDNALFLPKS